jgi:hypothetical protein
MAAADTPKLSPQEVGQRFELLAKDAKEYAVKPMDLKKLLELLGIVARP